MGCCGSKHADHDEAERARLLDESNDALRYGANRMVSANYGEQNQVRELESLQRIVERTAGNLIDIPSTLHLERLQQQEAQDRSNEYLSALNTVKLPNETIKKLYSMTSVVKAGADFPSHSEMLECNNHANGNLAVTMNGTQPTGVAGQRSVASSAGNSVKAPSVREVLAEKTIDSKTLGWMASAMGELHQATEQIDVRDVGDLIVTLSPVATQ